MSAELFVELQCEELPASMVRPALEGLRAGLEKILAGIPHGAAKTFASPRRLAVAFLETAPGRPVVERVITGPPAKAAFRDGEPTRAAQGFAKSKGVSVSDLEVVDSPRGEVVAARVKEGGEQTADLVAENLEELILNLPFAKSMEWGEGGFKFGRPLHRVSALYDGQVLDGLVAGLPIMNETAGHPLASNRTFHFTSAGEWLDGLRKRRVEPDLEVRRGRIQVLLEQAALDLEADPIDMPDLIEEVTHLVEWPTLIIGTFDEDLLALPPRLLVQSMTKHQRYFPIHRDGKLTNRFAIIANNPWGDEPLIAAGNARVLRARFYDARFFFAEDKKQSLQEHGEQLTRMRWIRGLSTVAAKQDRVAAIAALIAGAIEASQEDAAQAGRLCKCDLATQMVGEFPELQGHMGALYALAQGEKEGVATAIEEHYHPASAGDDPPKTRLGIAVALADRLDSLTGCFGVGLIPKGGGDPQGLRRAALGVVNILVARELRLNLEDLFRWSIDRFHALALDAPDGYQRWLKVHGSRSDPSDFEELIEQLVAFTLARFKSQCVADGVSADLVEAVLAPSLANPLVLDRKVKALRALTDTEDFIPIMHTFKRVLNITRGHSYPDPNPENFVYDAENELYRAIDNVEDDVATAVSELDFDRALQHMLTLKDPVANLFDTVMIESEDPDEKATRMGLLLRVGHVFLQVADFSRISTR